MRPEEVPTGSHYLLHDTFETEWSWAVYQKHLTCHTCLVGWEKQVLVNPVTVSTPRATDVERDRFVAYPLSSEQADAVIMAAMHLSDMRAWHRLCARIARRQPERQDL